MVIYIYISRYNKTIIGEAKINKVFYITRDKIIKKYKNRLMFNMEKFSIYSKGRERKRAMALELKNLIHYKQGKRIMRPMTMSGIFINSKNKDKVIGE